MEHESAAGVPLGGAHRSPVRAARTTRPLPHSRARHDLPILSFQCPMNAPGDAGLDWAGASEVVGSLLSAAEEVRGGQGGG